MPENSQISKFIENIKSFGEISDDQFKFKFQEGKNYNVTNKGLTATKIGENEWNCVIVGDKEIPKNRISKWKIKINKDKKNKTNNDIFIGIGPKTFKGTLYDECWSIASHRDEIKIKLKNKYFDYNSHKEKMKEGDIIEVIVDRKAGNLSFSVNDINYGLASSEIPKDDILFPTVVLYERGIEVELV